MTDELDLAAELLRMAEDPHVSLDLFRDRLAGAPELADEVVRIANEPRYGMPGLITRLERSVLILGPRTTASIAAQAAATRRRAPLCNGPERAVYTAPRSAPRHARAAIPRALRKPRAVRS